MPSLLAQLGREAILIRWAEPDNGAADPVDVLGLDGNNPIDICQIFAAKIEIE